MARYILKDPSLAMIFPDAVEAEVWWKNGDHPLDYAEPRTIVEGGDVLQVTGAIAKAKEWEGGVVRYFRRPDVRGDYRCNRCGAKMDEHELDRPGRTGDQGPFPGDMVVDAGIKDDKQMRVAMRVTAFAALYYLPPAG